MIDTTVAAQMAAYHDDLGKSQARVRALEAQLEALRSAVAVLTCGWGTKLGREDYVRMVNGEQALAIQQAMDAAGITAAQDARFAGLAERFAHYTECQLATVEYLAGVKRTPKGELARQTNIADGMVAVCQGHGILGKRNPRLEKRLGAVPKSKADGEAIRYVRVEEQ